MLLACTLLFEAAGCSCYGQEGICILLEKAVQSVWAQVKRGRL